MTEDPLARLRAELVGAAERRNAACAPASVPAGRRRRRRGGWLTIAAVLVAAPAAATAAGIIDFGRSAGSQARVIVVEVLRDTAGQPACSRTVARSTVLSDASPIAAITDTLPALRRPAPNVDAARMVRSLRPRPPGGPVLRRTVRRMTMPGDLQITAYVQAGAGFSGARDPAACAALRRERGDVLARDRSEGVKRALAKRLADLDESATQVQTLVMFGQSPVRRASSVIGAGAPVTPGRRLRTGLFSSGSTGSGTGARMYLCIAGPRIVQVRLSTTHPDQTSRIPARVRVVDGFYGFVLPPGTGPVTMREIAADGRVLRVRHVRR